MKKAWFVLLFFLCPSLYAQTAPWVGVLAPSRAVDWSNAGVVGGIPNRTNICSTLTSSATSAQINAAIASCGSAGGGVVSLGAGTYSSATNGFSIETSNVTVRGAGANQTFFATSGGASGHGPAGSLKISSTDGSGSSSPGNLTTWTVAGQSGPYLQGTSQIQLASVANLKIGNPIVLDQLDSPSDNGALVVTQSTSALPFVAPGSAGPYSTQGAGQNVVRGSCHGNNTCWSQEQVVQVTSCNGVTTPGAACTGTNVTIGISPGLEMPNWAPANSPSAWWSSSPVLNSGIEDLSIDNIGCSGCDGIVFYNAQNSWLKGVRSMNSSGEGHIAIQYSDHISIVNNYLFLAVNAAPASYGVECGSCSDNLIENNITNGVTTPYIANGTMTGTVWGYNYSANEYYVSSPGYNIPAYGDHAAGIGMTLREGNIGNGPTGDTIHGVAHLMTFFRDYFQGLQPVCFSSTSGGYAGSTYAPCNNNVEPMLIFAYHRFYNVIGSILGTPGVNTTYDSGSLINGTSTNVYGVGYGNGGVPGDANVHATLMRWGNADPVTGFGSPRFDCSEVPTALTGVQAPFSNPCPSSNTLPGSFYYSAQPSWWPSGKPWPPIGPDVSSGNLLVCSGGTQNASLVTSAAQCPGGTTSVAAGGHANSTPAMDCYLGLGGLPNGTGPALTNFNEATCYSQTVSNKPQPPTNVTATVN